MDINKNITLTVVTNPNSQQVAAAIQNAFQSKLAAVLKRLPPPSETLIAQNIVTAQTA
jgi:predicted Zn-dependent peptidase